MSLCLVHAEPINSCQSLRSVFFICSVDTRHSTTEFSHTSAQDHVTKPNLVWLKLKKDKFKKNYILIKHSSVMKFNSHEVKGQIVQTSKIIRQMQIIWWRNRFKAKIMNHILQNQDNIILGKFTLATTIRLPLKFIPFSFATHTCTSFSVSMVTRANSPASFCDLSPPTLQLTTCMIIIKELMQSFSIKDSEAEEWNITKLDKDTIGNPCKTY